MLESASSQGCAALSAHSKHCEITLPTVFSCFSGRPENLAEIVFIAFASIILKNFFFVTFDLFNASRLVTLTVF